jgi:2-dehydropantoate 2-reductase
MSENTLKILSFGAGAIGTYIGGSLALAGHEVTFVERPEVAEALNARGLRLDLTLDKRRKTLDTNLIPPADLVFADSLEKALAYGPFDVALFALKSYDTQNALNEIEKLAEKMPPHPLPAKRHRQRTDHRRNTRTGNGHRRYSHFCRWAA